MSNKAKGSKAERELYDLLVKNNYRAVRVAGSGTMENADCDLIAGNLTGKKFAIEVKSSKSPHKYISKDQMSRFIVFSKIFELKPVIALRFNREAWIFLDPTDLNDSGKNFGISLEEAKQKGKRFFQFFE